MNNVMYSAFLDELTKIAEVDAVTDAQSAVVPDEQTPPVYREHPAVTTAKGIGGFALGAGLGYVGAHYTNKALGSYGLSPHAIQVGAPLAAGAAGLGFSYLQHMMMEKMKDHAQHQGDSPNEQLNQGA